MPKHDKRNKALLNRGILIMAVKDSFRKLSPRHVMKNPVMFVVEVGSLVTSAELVKDIVSPSGGNAPVWFTLCITVFLWFTLLFANFAEAMAEEVLSLPIGPHLSLEDQGLVIATMLDFTP